MARSECSDGGDHPVSPHSCNDSQQLSVRNGSKAVAATLGGKQPLGVPRASFLDERRKHDPVYDPAKYRYGRVASHQWMPSPS